MRHRWTTRAALAVVATLAVLGLAACGEETALGTSDESAAGANPPDSAPPAGDELVLRVDTGGGFVPIEVNLTHLPQLSVYADGLVLDPAPTILIYPGPALPTLNARELDEEGLELLEGAVEASGLASAPPDYGQPPIADAPTTTVTLTFGGATYEHVAYALGMADDPQLPGLTEEQRSARQRLGEFVAEVTDLTTLVGAEHVRDAGPWVPERYRLWAQPASDVPPGTPPQPVPTTTTTTTSGAPGDPNAAVSSPAMPPPSIDGDGTDGTDGSGGVAPGEPAPRLWAWPIEEVDLGAVGRCLVVEGEVADEVGALFAQADQLTRFDQGGVAYVVVARPLLPDEVGCADEG